MGQVLRAFPEQPSKRQAVTLGLLSFGIRMRWHHRQQAWYIDVYAANGDAVLLASRVSPGWSIGFGLNQPGMPDGPILANGPGEYRRRDLGSSVNIVFYSSADLTAAQAAAATTDDIVVVINP